jgi:Dolichyl-phosphate-mannose-protein mannosyltransferase
MNVISVLLSSRIYRGVTLVVLLISCAGVALLGWRHLNAQPDFVFLTDDAPGHWIVYPSPPNLVAGYSTVEFAVFRTGFDLAEVPDALTLSFRSLTVADVYVNGVRIYQETEGPDFWKTIHAADLTPHLRMGTNTLQFNVANTSGPAVLWAAIPGLGMGSDETWEASRDGESWVNATRADSARWAEIGRDYPRAQDAFRAWFPWMLIPIGAFLLVGLLLRVRPMPDPWKERLLSPEALRWVLLVALAMLGARNLGQLDILIGMDSSYHYQYTHFLLDHHALPPVIEGFRSPLPYFIYAIAHTVFSWFTSSEHADLYLRVIPIACGLLQVELSFRTARLLFPGQRSVQTTGLLVGSMLPMGVYMSQVISDEVIAAAFGSWALYLGMRLLIRREESGYDTIVWIGVAAGMALLSKFNMVLLLPTLLGCILLWAYAKPKRVAQGIAGATAFILPVAAIAGWFYVRNYLEVSKFLVGGWDQVIGIDWWQHPGFQTPDYFLRFGQALQYPVYSAVASFWDGLYSATWLDANLSGMANVNAAPPWNLTPMLAGTYFGLIPTVLIIGGIVAAAAIVFLRRSVDFTAADWAVVLCAGTLAVFGAAILYHALTVPFYSSTKPTYALGITPALVALVSLGAAKLPDRFAVPRLVLAGLACWGITVYCAYFVV